MESILDFVLRYWLEVGFGALLVYIQKTNNYKLKKANEEKQRLMDEKHELLMELKDQAKEIMGLKEGFQALLRDRIIQGYHHYMEKGFYPIYARDNINGLFKQYLNFGGNGTVPELYERLNDLPTNECDTE